MHRKPLLRLLDRYEVSHPDERLCVERIRTLIRGHADCFERSCIPGHITASVWIASADRNRFLLTHHRKLGRWLQLGGHADGQADVAAVALREAREESGLRDFDWLASDSTLLVVDVDVHDIPPHSADPAHEHHDVRFVLIARPDQKLSVSDESLDLRWFEMEQLESIVDEESLLRLGRKARTLLSSASAWSGPANSD